MVREIHNTARVATLTRKTLPFHEMPNATPIGLFPTDTHDWKKGVFAVIRK